MTIETKFQIGDAIFFLEENKVSKARVDSVRVIIANISAGGTSIDYSIQGLRFSIKESEAFSTKEELLKSL